MDPYRSALDALQRRNVVLLDQLRAAESQAEAYRDELEELRRRFDAELIIATPEPGGPRPRRWVVFGAAGSALVGIAVLGLIGWLVSQAILRSPDAGPTVVDESLKVTPMAAEFSDAFREQANQGIVQCIDRHHGGPAEFGVQLTVSTDGRVEAASVRNAGPPLSAALVQCVQTVARECTLPPPARTARMEIPVAVAFADFED